VLRKMPGARAWLPFLDAPEIPAHAIANLLNGGILSNLLTQLVGLLNQILAAL